MIWSIKESLSKVLKTGMMIDFVFLEIDSIILEHHTVISTFRHFKQYKSISWNNQNYVASITLPRKSEADLSQVQSLFDSLKN